mmetsp:Transcript_16326/g.39346  ORF Transcript_16326/g.39346 Transcript_16326/m.39346 type:complete len:158 (+) Transcript_16326:116-589(+)
MQMTSASLIVLRRCAILTTVMPACDTRSIACSTSFSLSLSSADVASSSSSTLGCLISARAMARRCFCPPDSCIPLSPTKVSYPSGKREMNSCALATSATLLTSSSVASSRPYLMLSAMETAKSTGSWGTEATTPLSHSAERSLTLCPSRSTVPCSGS